MPIDSAPQPLVTIAVSAYNHEPYIADCLKSLLNQSYNNFELVVFDDGSTDNTTEIINEFHNHHTFQFEKRPNRGLTPTLNALLKVAKGKYFTVIGSDDIATLDKIEKQVALMEKDDSIALCGGNILKIDQAGNILPRQKFHPYHELDFETLLLNKAPGLPAPTLFFRTSVLREIGGYHEQIKLEDLYIVLKISEQGHKLVFMNDLLAYYRVHPSNTYKDLGYMSENIFATLEQFKNSPLQPEAHQKAVISLFIKASKRNKPLARKLLKQIKPTNHSLRTIKAFLRLFFT